MTRCALPWLMCQCPHGMARPISAHTAHSPSVHPCPCVLQAITKAGYQQPTAIQAQALPAALSGRDVLVREAWQAEQQSLPCFFFSVECSTAHSLSSRRVVLVGRAPLTSCATLSPHAPPILLPAGHRQDWQRQDSCLCAAHAGAHHGPARASGDSWGVAGFSRLCHLLLLMWRKVGVNWWPARAAGEGQMGRL